MSEARYNVVLSGSALEGFELSQVKEEFAKLFSLAEAKTERMFSKGNVVIKKNIAKATAHQFIAALERIGAAAHLLPLKDEEVATGPQLEPLAKQTSSAAESPAITSENEAPKDAAAPIRAEKTAAAELSQPSTEPFVFHGDGSEYFRIWIVNILLTILTLGIYSAWAKVRNAQYFYGHTEVAGSRFAYLAKPLTILKGRIIAVVLFVIYSLVSNLSPAAGLVMSLLLIIALPWIAVRSLRFNRRMTAWRNIRFNFDGQTWPAAQVFILWPLAGLITIGLLMPLAMYKQNEFIINNSCYGTARFELNPCTKDFYMIFVSAAGMMLLAGIIGWSATLLLPAIGGIVWVVAYLYLFVFISVRSANLIFNNSILRDGDFSFSSTWTDGSYLKLLFINSLFTLLTLGFYYPWAMVRTATYKAERLELNAETDLNGFVAGEAANVSAFGEEMGDVFDMEFGI
ncbi:MAG: YjgN family protein [Motiliproteus sp.]